ncbi:MAG: short-chain fatty acyl-CoA regulator family protein [Acetobacteraceae bacterium]
MRLWNPASVTNWKRYPIRPISRWNAWPDGRRDCPGRCVAALRSRDTRTPFVGDFGTPRPRLSHGVSIGSDGGARDDRDPGVGLSCRLCDRPDCRSRAFPPLEHRLSLDPTLAGVTPYRFEVQRG